MNTLLKLTLLTVASTLGGTAIFLGVVELCLSQLVEDAGVVLALWLLPSVLVTFFCTRALLRTMKDAKEECCEAFRETPEDEVIARWSMPVARWNKLRESLKEEDQEIGMMAALLGAGIFFLCSLSLTSLPNAVLIGIGGAMLCGVMAFAMSRIQHVTGIDSESPGSTRIDVVLRPDGLMLNGSDLILWTGSHGSLESAECAFDSKLGFPTLDLVVRRLCGSSHVHATYRVPVPEEQVEELQKVIG